MSEKCHDNLFVKPFEICNIMALNKLNLHSTDEMFNISPSNIFNDKFLNINTDINKNIRNKGDNEYIYKYDSSNKDLCYSINSANNAYNLNCVIAMGSPFFSFDEKTNSCQAIKNLKPPDGFKSENDYIYKENNQDDIKYDYNMNKAYCENKWYDWIITPNYHFGNQFYKDSGKFSGNDIYKCYKPCKKGYMSYTSDVGNMICVEKNLVLDGIYKDKLDFSPIALINALGNSKEDIQILYNNLFNEKTLNLINENQKYSRHYSNITKYLIKNELEWDTNNANYQNLKLGSKFDFNSENLKYEMDTMYNDLIKTVNNDILNIQMFSDGKNLDLENLKNIITYKNPNFNEDDPELLTLIGMGNANMLSDVILIHTYYLAYKFCNFIEKDIFNIANYDGNNLKPEINKYNICEHIKNNLKIKTDDNFKYIKRLTNIFYKAINICYNNTTDFSINLIIQTKNAIKKTINSDNISFLPNYLISSMDNNDLTININFYDYGLSSSDLDNLIDDNNDITIKTKIKENVLNLISHSIILIYSKEECEYTGCKQGEIRDGKDCKKCKDVCIDKNNCNFQCKTLCPNLCTTNNVTNISKCGNVKETRESTYLTKEEIITPVENDFEMPDINFYFKLAIKIFFALITLYIGYIFYEIYGETLFNIYNWLEMTVIYIWYYIKNFLLNRNVYKADVDYATIVKTNADNKYAKVFRGVKSIPKR